MLIVLVDYQPLPDLDTGGGGPADHQGVQRLHDLQVPGGGGSVPLIALLAQVHTLQRRVQLPALLARVGVTPLDPEPEPVRQTGRLIGLRPGVHSTSEENEQDKKLKVPNMYLCVT